jgi:hypothetical protein
MYHSNVSFWAFFGLDTFSSIYPPLPSMHVSSRLSHVKLTEEKKQKFRTVVMIEGKRIKRHVSSPNPIFFVLVPNPTQSRSQTPT